MRLAVRQNLPFWVTLLFILGLALFTRLYQLGTAPQGITWDEAALGYVGRMVVTTTRDEYGQRLPITFTSFGDYKSPLAFYFTGLSTTLFGLSPWAVRLPFALAGIGSILLMMWLVWRLWRERWIAALAGFLMITMPWHFLFSRIGFEVGVVLLFLLLVLAAWVELHLLPDRTPRWRPLALTGLMVTGVVAGLYTYHAAKLVFPMVLVSMFAHDVLHHRQWLKKRWRLILGLVVATGVLSVPLLLDIFHGPGIERATQTSFVGTLPWWPTLVRTSQNLGAHLNLQFLLWGETSILRHGTPDYGVFLWPHWILFWLGITFGLGRFLQGWRRDIHSATWWEQLLARLTVRGRVNQQVTPGMIRSWFWLILLVITLLPAAIGQDVPHANRALLAVVPTLMLMILGGRELRAELTPQPFATLIGSLLLLLTLQFSVFWQYYFTTYQRQASADWLEGYAPAVRLAQHYQQQGRQVKFTTYYGQPLTFYAFYNRLPIETYRQFRVPGIEFSPVRTEDELKYDVVIAAPAEPFPGDPTQIIRRQDQKPAFYVYEQE